MTNVFDRRESEIRSYCRAFPAVFAAARGSCLYDEEGREYLDFFAGAGTLNYGHNNPMIKRAVLDYLEQDGIVHALDMWTVAKRTFLEEFEATILDPRKLDYKVQFTGPTGTNAVEAAMKLARKVKGRRNIIAFTNAYHGLTSAALSATGNRHFRNEAFVNRLDVSFVPYDGYLGEGINTLDYLRKLLGDASSGMDLPAAVLLETIQAEGGINIARVEWLRGLAALCREYDILLIVDDIQVGNGRSGDFFSFEWAGIKPDMVTLSKSIGGLGLPMSLVLLDRAIDIWKPAEHTGTFRGNNLAFVAATAALAYWKTPLFRAEVVRKGEYLLALLGDLVREHAELRLRVRGRGLIGGLEFQDGRLAQAVAQGAFKRGLIIERAGPEDQVLKFLPPLVIEDAELERGVRMVDDSIREVLGTGRCCAVGMQA